MAHSPDIVALLPEQMLVEIGKIIASWSYVEHLFDMVYTRLIVMEGRPQSDGARLPMLGKPFKVRMRELRAAIATTSEAEIDASQQIAWERMLSQLGSLRNKRDFIAHSQIYPVSLDKDKTEEAAVSFKSWRNQKPHLMAKVTLSKLKKTREEISRAWIDLMKLEHAWVQLRHAAKPS